jgi:hypothetical protein
MLLSPLALVLACGESGGSSSSDSTARPAVNFSSSFEAEQGASATAVRDGETWDDILGFQNQLLTVVGPENGINPIDGTSMLRVGISNEQHGGVIARDAIDLTSNDIYIRFYVNKQCIADDVAFTHYVQDCDTQLGLCDSRNFYWTTSNYDAATGRYRMGWQSYADQRGPGSGCNGDGLYFNNIIRSWGTIQNPSPDIEEAVDPNGLECERWYRVEVRVACMEPSCLNRNRDEEVATRIHTRVYDDGGRLIIGDAQMRSMSVGGVWQGGTAGVSMEEAYSASGMNSCYYMSAGRPSLHFGNNGQQGTNASADAWMYFDSIATSSAGWIGP